MAEEKKTFKEAKAEAKTAVGMQAVDKIIADFESIRTAQEQRKKFTITLVDVNDGIKNFGNSKKVEFQIKFICAIDPYILTAASGRREKYIIARGLLIGLIDFFNYELIRLTFFYRETTASELVRAQRLLNNLLHLLQENIEDSKADAEELDGYINLTNTSIAQIIGAVKERLKEAETVGNLKDQADFFAENSEKYKESARWFLVGAGITFGVFVCVIFLLTNYFSEVPLSEAKEAKEYIYFYIALKSIFSLRVLLSVSLLVILFASIRFYAANKHNAVVCDQRANTLQSYKALRNSAEGVEERLLVLQKILDAATDHQPSGFSKEDKDGDSLIGKSLAELVILLRGKSR